MFLSGSRLIAGLAVLMMALAGAASAQAPTLSLSPSTVPFAAPVGGGSQTAQVSVLSSGSQIVWYLDPGLGMPSWVSYTPGSGLTGSNVLSVTINPAGLTAGSYNWTFKVWSPQSQNAISSAGGLSLTVTLQVGITGTIAVSPTSLAFQATAGGGNPAAQGVTVTTTFTTPIIATANVTYTTGSGWLQVTPSSGTLSSSAPLTLAVAPVTGSLAAGNYTATLSVSSGASTQNVTVTFQVQPGSIISAASPVNLTAVQGSTTTQDYGVVVSNSSGSAVTVTPSVSAGQSWLTLVSGAVSVPASGTNNVTIRVNPSGLPVGTHSATLTLTPSTGTAINVTVNFTITATSSLTLSRTSMLFNTTTSASDTFTISTASATAISYDVTWTYQQGNGWLNVTPNTVGSVTNVSPATLTVTVSPQAFGLTTGTYNATISIAGGGTTQTIAVTLAVNTAAISASPTSLAINAASGTSGYGSVTITSTSPVTVQLTNGQSIYCTSPSYQFCATVDQTSRLVQPGSPGVFQFTSWPSLPTGTYSVNLNFSSSVGSITVPLTIYVGTGGGGTLSFNPLSMSLTSAVGGGVQSQSLSISGGVPGNYSAVVTQGGNWLSIGTQSSTFYSVYVPGVVTIYANPLALTAGTYYGQISFTGAGGTSYYNVNFAVGTGGTGNLTVSPATVNLTAAVGGQSSIQTVNVYGATTTTYSASVQGGVTWLTLLNATGTTPGALQMYASAAALPAGSYSATVSVISSIGSQTISVTFVVGGGTGALTANPSSLSFTAAPGTNPAAQSFTLSSTTAVTFSASATVSTGSGWLAVSPTSGATTSTLTVTVTSASLAAGAYSGQINIVSSVGNLTVPVSLIVGSTTPGTITATPTALQFSADAGGAPTPYQTINLTTTAASADYLATPSVNWLSVQPVAGTLTSSGAQLQVAASAASLAAGTYNGYISITGGGGTILVQVTFVVGGGGGGTGTCSGGGLTATPCSITLTSPAGSTAAQLQYITLSAATATAFSAIASTTTGAGWLTVSPQSGSAPATLAVQASPIGLTNGVYFGNVYVTSTAGGSLTIPVTFNVGTGAAGNLVVSPTTLAFNGQTGAATLPAQYISVQSATQVSTLFSATVSGASWLSVSPASGYTPQSLTVTANPAGLAAGSYTGSISIVSSDGLSQQTVTVTLTLTAANITVSPASLTFTGSAGASTAPQSLSISSPLGALAFTAIPATSTGVQWLTVSSTSGTTPTSINVTANAAGLSAGSYSGTITITASGIGTVSVPVTFTVVQPFAMTVAPETLAFEAAPGATSIPTKTVNVNVSTGNQTFTATASTTSGGGWLTVSPASGTTPGTLTVTANPTGLSSGTYNGTVTVTISGATNSPRTVAVTLTIASPAPVVTAVLNAAAGNAGILAAGTITSIYGQRLGPETAAYPSIVAGGLVPTQVGGVRVLFDGIPAPILYAQARQINTVIPWSLYGRATVRVEVEYQNNRSTAVQVQLYDAAPAIFTIDGSGLGQAAALNQDGSVNGQTNGALPETVVAFYATGAGLTEPQGVDGSIPTSVLPKPVLPASVLLGNTEAAVEYAGAAPYLVSGALQVNIRIPRGLQPGAYPVTLRLGRFSSQLGVTIVVR